MWLELGEGFEDDWAGGKFDQGGEIHVRTYHSAWKWQAEIREEDPGTWKITTFLIK